MDVCTPRVFKVVRVPKNQRQINAFWNLFGDEKQDLGRHVRELMYQDGDDEQQTAGKRASSKAIVSRFSFNPNHLFKLSSVEPTIEALSNSYFFPNLDTARFIFHFYGLSAGDLAHDTAEHEVQSDLQAEDLLKSMSFEFLLNISTFMVCICSRRPNFLLPRRGSWLFCQDYRPCLSMFPR